MPVLFLGHGSPMNAIEENIFVQTWREIEQTITRPKAILCISAHWESKGSMLTSSAHPATIHDFGGFPKALYDIHYPANGNPELALSIQSMLSKTNVEMDDARGFDHGCWSVISRMYPNADIPLIQLSLDYRQKPQFHYDLGKELAALREQGVLIVGSGNMVHNLAMIAWDKLSASAYSYDWAVEANNLMKSYILSGDHHKLIEYQSQGEAFDLAIPTPEHFIPLLYILALKNDSDDISFFNDITVGGSLSMTSVRIG